MKATALVLSDLHAHNWPRFSTVTPEGLNSRFQDLLDVLKQAQAVVEQEEPEILILLGDLTHRRHFITFKLYNALLAALYELSRRVEQTWVVVGNHDLEDTHAHSLQALSYFPSTMVTEKPVYTWDATGWELPVTIIPYLPDPLAVSAAFHQAPLGGLVLSHYAAEGCPLETDYWLPSPVKLGELGRFGRVVFGHVHKPSEQLDGKVVYNGAPMQFDFGDAGARGGLLLYEDLSWKRVWFEAPTFHTATYPRIPVAPGGPRAFLRVLNVPKAELMDVRTSLAEYGWADGLVLEEALPQEVRQAVSRGLVVDEATLRAYVSAGSMVESEQEALITVGLSLLEAARA